MFSLINCFRPLYERSIEDLYHGPLVSVTTSHHQTFVHLYKHRKSYYRGLCPKAAIAGRCLYLAGGASLQRWRYRFLTLIAQVGVPLLQPSKPSNAVWISSASSEMQSKLKDTVGSIFASDSDKSDKTITKDQDNIK